MPVTHFPDPSLADADGLVAVGGDLHPETLLLAYRSGIFPWPLSGDGSDKNFPLTWFSPDPRAVLEFDRLHIPRSLERSDRRRGYQFTVDRDFESVIQACAKAPRPGQAGTWITSAMIHAYIRLHRAGRAHSVEAWATSPDGRRELIGGIYGVDVDGVFAGESMFHRRPDASKLALLHLVGRLTDAGCRWMDIQMLTPHLEALGAREVPRAKFLKILAEERSRGLMPFGEAP